MSESSGSANPEQHVEREVESLISEAATLADDLSDEVGAEPRPAKSEHDMDVTSLDTEPDPSKNIERGIDAVSDAIDQTTQELGSAPPTDPPKPKKTLSLPPKGAQKKSVALPPKGGTAADKSTTDSKPGGETVVGLDDDDLADIDGSVEKPPADRPRGPVVSAINAMAMILADGLDMVDRPFARLGPTIRAVLGWVALVLFVAAASLFFFAVL